MALPSPRHDGTALVTGASSGIGESFARELVKRGFGVTLVARRADKLAELAEELSGTLHDVPSAADIRVEVLACDLSDRAAREALPRRVDELGLTVDILVNNAGLSTWGPITAADPAREANMIEVDVAAVADLCVRFVPGMVERGRGGVINVASTASFQPLPGQSAYAASKAFVLSYSRGLAGELRGTPVGVTVVCPGPVKTGFNDAAGIDQGEAEATLPKFMWETADTVACAAIDGLASGRSVVIPGAANRLAAMAAQLTPKRVLVPILAKQHPALK